MNCQQATKQLDGYLDNELDPVRSQEFEQHLKECVACSGRYQQAQALRKVVKGSSLYFEAPEGLARRVRTALRKDSKVEAPSKGRSWDLSWLWSRALAPAAIAALVLLLVLPGLMQNSTQNRLAREVVSAHLRSLLANHLTDVASTDQHTVKPWFNGKLTFAPPVVNPATQGYPLVGGRLDVIEEQTVAALVYQRRQHYINLLVRPTNRNDTGPKFLTQRGYNLVHWIKNGMDCWAVSDVNRDDLREFAQLAGGM